MVAGVIVGRVSQMAEMEYRPMDVNLKRVMIASTKRDAIIGNV
jgi:hypothetical protein